MDIFCERLLFHRLFDIIKSAVDKMFITLSYSHSVDKVVYNLYFFPFFCFFIHNNFLTIYLVFVRVAYIELKNNTKTNHKYYNYDRFKYFLY